MFLYHGAERIFSDTLLHRMAPVQVLICRFLNLFVNSLHGNDQPLVDGKGFITLAFALQSFKDEANDMAIGLREANGRRGL